MNKWLVLTAIMALLMGIQSLRAEGPVVCPQGRAVFGKLVCAGASSPEPVVDAYFYGATSLSEIRAVFPARAEKIGDTCRRKVAARQLATSPENVALEREALQFRVVPVESCLGKRGYQQPCVRDEDCLEHFCHPERGVCSGVFTVPLSAP